MKHVMNHLLYLAALPLLLSGLQACGGGGGGETSTPTTAITPTPTPAPEVPPTTAPAPAPTPTPTPTTIPLAYRLSDTVDAAKPDYVKAMATLPNGNVVATLIQSDTIVVDDAQHSSTGSAHTLSGAGSDTGVVVYDKATGEALTRFSFGGTAPRVVSHGIAADSAGNLVVIGYAAGTGTGTSTVNFDSTSPDVSFTGGEVPFIAKFNASGILQWAHVLQGSSGVSPNNCTSTNCDRAYDVALTPTGDIGVVGNFSGQLAIPGGTTLTSAGGSDLFALVFDASGTLRAAWTIGGAGNDGGFAGTTAAPGGLGEMALVATQNTATEETEWVIQGTFSPATEFKGTGASSVQRTPANNARDAFVARYNAAGVLQGTPWTAGAVADVTGGLSAPGAMRSDTAGNLYLSLRFNPGVQTINGCANPTQTGERLHVLSLNSSLACRWITRFDFTPGGIHRTVADSQGHVYVAGWFLGSHTFANQTLTARSTRSDIFLARLDATSGAAQWGSGAIATAAVAASNIPAGLTIDGDGHPWMGGQIFAATEFSQTAQGQASKILATSFSGAIVNNSNDGFVARYDKNDGRLR